MATRILCILAYWMVFLLPTRVEAQYYDAGHEPGSTRWKIVRTPSFRMIFPDTLEEMGRSTAETLDRAILQLDTFFSLPLKPLPVVLHNQKSISNAFAGWAPSRMEFYTTPPPDGYAHLWADQLCIHESTHWYQYSRMYRGVTGFGAKLYGEHFPALVMGLYIPFWAIEGEAVYYETLLSGAGRGRDAPFEQLMRARLTTRKQYSYDKAYLGSFRTLTPDHYELGYQLVAYGIYQFGPLMWDSVYRYVARNPLNPWAFTCAMKRVTGMGKTKFYSAAMRHLSKEWRDSDTALTPDTLPLVLKSDNRWSRYQYPVPFRFGELAAVKVTQDEIPALVQVSHNGTEKVLCYPGYTFGDGISRCDRRVYFTALSRHPRWPNVEYSDIWAYDAEYDTLARITRHQRFFSPVEDPVNGELYALQYHPDHRFSLVRMSLSAEMIYQKFLPTGWEASHAAWWDGGDRLVLVVTGPEGKALFSWDGEEDLVRLTPFTRANIAHPQGYKEGILFQAAFSGISQIYLFSPKTGTTSQITASRFGAMYPSADLNGDLLYARVHPLGTELCSLQPEYFLMQPVEWPEMASGFVMADAMDKTLMFSDNRSAKASSEDYRPERYRPGRELFRFHSWSFPVSIDPEAETVKPGFSILSQNTLSTTFFRGALDMEPADRSVDLNMSFTYKGFWPWISVKAGHVWTTVQHPDTSIGRFGYRSPYADVTFRLPLNFLKRHRNRSLNLETGFTYLAFRHMKSTPENFIRGGLLYNHSSISWFAVRRMAAKDLYPKFGWGFSLRSVSTFAGDLDAGTVMGARTFWYLPGPFANHGIRMDLGIQHRTDGNDLRFNRVITLPRGYAYLDSVNSAFTASCNYRLPLLYPDLSMPPVFYVKRISATAFFDLLAPVDQSAQTFYSYGVELLADVHLLRHFAPFQLGWGFAIRKDKTLWNYPLFGVSFSI
jgi:hypothetical protein